MAKLYKVTITGWVVYEDFGVKTELTPADWGVEELAKEMLGTKIEETLLDTLDEGE